MLGATAICRVLDDVFMRIFIAGICVCICIYFTRRRTCHPMHFPPGLARDLIQTRGLDLGEGFPVFGVFSMLRVRYSDILDHHWKHGFDPKSQSIVPWLMKCISISGARPSNKRRIWVYANLLKLSI